MFDLPEAEPCELFVNPFACNVDPFMWEVRLLPGTNAECGWGSKPWEDHHRTQVGCPVRNAVASSEVLLAAGEITGGWVRGRQLGGCTNLALVGSDMLVYPAGLQACALSSLQACALSPLGRTQPRQQISGACILQPNLCMVD